MLKKTILMFTILYLITLISFYFFQEKIIFQSKTYSKNYNYSFNANFEEINLKTKDGAFINGILFKVKNPKGIILYFHGNKGSLKRWGNLCLPLTGYGYDVFVIDYRGYGKSKGLRTETIMYNDVQFCYEYLLKSYDENSIIVYGRSLGGTFATYVASKNKPKLLILEATFNNMIDVMSNNLPILPYAYLLKYKFETSQLISKVNVPTIIFHGNKDRLISIDLSKKLYEKSNKKYTKFIELNGATHHNIGKFKKYKNTLIANLK